MIIPVAPTWATFAAASFAHTGMRRLARLNESQN